MSAFSLPKRKVCIVKNNKSWSSNQDILKAAICVSVHLILFRVGIMQSENVGRWHIDQPRRRKDYDPRKLGSPNTMTTPVGQSREVIDSTILQCCAHRAVIFVGVKIWQTFVVTRFLGNHPPHSPQLSNCTFSYTWHEYVFVYRPRLFVPIIVQQHFHSFFFLKTFLDDIICQIVSYSILILI